MRRRSPPFRPWLLAFLLGAPAGWAFAAGGPVPARDPADDALLVSAGYLAHHPDIDNRIRGMRAYRTGEHGKAMAYFRRAAYFADKPSQGMVAEMLWDGVGATQDRALAYAWMDLAAERGYAGFLGMRERYWLALSPQEQVRAVEAGRGIYARFGDAIAKPRIDARLRLGLREATGSRTGFAGALTIEIPGPDGNSISVPGSRFYDPRYWDPKAYWAWQDAVWMKPRIGRVDVGGIESLPPTPDTPRASRIGEGDGEAADPALPPAGGVP
jgi:hypothetical protein